MTTRSVDLPRAARAIHDFLEAVGAPDSASDPELKDTGNRVAQCFHDELLAGYRESPAAILADALPATAQDPVIVRDIQTSTLCPHHLMPAMGYVHLAYLPNTTIVGFGALVKLVHCFAKRLILQETLTQNIAEALITHLNAHGAGCVIHMQPTCLTARGPHSHQAKVTTISFQGEFKSNQALQRVLLEPMPR